MHVYFTENSQKSPFYELLLSMSLQKEREPSSPREESLFQKFCIQRQQNKGV